MGYSQEDIAKVREATDIVSLVAESVVLRQRRDEFWGCCPFHQEKTPSFKLNPTTQLWHCFGCNLGGDVFNYLMLRDNLDFREALEALADRAHITIVDSWETSGASKRSERLIATCEETANFYNTMLLRGKGEQSKAAREYLSSRAFSADIAKAWKLGYAQGSGALVKHLKDSGFTNQEMIDTNVAVLKNGKLADRFFSRIIFPIHDAKGNTIAFGGRILGEGNPKYLNTSDTPIFHKGKNLYGLDVAKNDLVKTRTAIVVEGYTDTIALHAAGFPNTVATLGTALTPEHVAVLTRYVQTIVYLFDGDEAGRRAADRASSLIPSLATPEAGRRQLELKVALIPGGADPADYVSSAGTPALQEVLDKAQSLLRYAIDRRLEGVEITTAEQKSRAAAKVLELLIPVRSSIVANEYLVYLADRLMLPLEQLKLDLSRLHAPKTNVSKTNTSNSISDTPQTRSSSSLQVPQVRDDLAKEEGFAFAPLTLNVDEQGKWEMWLIYAFANFPQTRDFLGSVIELGLNWSNIAISNIAKDMLELSESLHDANPKMLSAELLAKHPEASDLWNSAIAEAELKNDENLSAKVNMMIKQRRIAELLKAQNQAENEIKYSQETLSEENKNALIEKIADLQKELASLRK